MRWRKYKVKDDSVTKRGRGHPRYVGKSVSMRGEEFRQQRGLEPGRYDAPGDERGGGEARKDVVGKSTARDSTGVDPLEPIDPRMPNLRTP